MILQRGSNRSVESVQQMYSLVDKVNVRSVFNLMRLYLISNMTSFITVLTIDSW
jgi:hypothetical protein